MQSSHQASLGTLVILKVLVNSPEVAIRLNFLQGVPSQSLTKFEMNRAWKCPSFLGEICAKLGEGTLPPIILQLKIAHVETSHTSSKWTPFSTSMGGRVTHLSLSPLHLSLSPLHLAKLRMQPEPFTKGSS